MTSRPLRVNTRWSKGTHEVLQLVLSTSRTYREIPTCGDVRTPGDVVWVVSKEDIETVLPLLKPRQWIARIPGVSEVCKKVATCLMFRPYAEANPDAFDFLPTTWVLPEQHNDLMTVLEGRRPPTVIFKPSDGSQGDGIYLLQGKKDVCRRISILSERGNGAAVVQRYVRHPLLFEGMKFDLRLYVVILDVTTAESYLCREGLVRFCTTLYDPPTSSNLHKCCMHLTNYSINKMSKEFDHDDTNGSKRLLSVFMAQMAATGIDTAAVWDAILRLTSHTVKVVCETVTATNPPFTCKAFHVIGIDILLDKHLRPFLLELNNNPSMRVDATHTIASGAVPAPGKKPCKCMSHYMPHVHTPCAVDVAAKSAVTHGVLGMVRRGADVEAVAEAAGFDVVPVAVL